MEMVSNRQASCAFFGGIGAAIAVAALCLFAGCKSYYENAGMRVRTGEVTAPIELSEPTSSMNIRFLFFLNGVDLYSTKGSEVRMKYYSAKAGSWLTSATTQSVEVAILPWPTNAVQAVAK